MIVEDTKKCEFETCGATFVKPENMRPSQWENKRFCGPKCAAGWRTAQLMAGLKPPTCQNEKCGGPVERRPRDTINTWQKRKYCCVECANAGAVKKGKVYNYDPKPCENPDCENKIYLDTSHKNMSKARLNFRKRKYCSLTCNMKVKNEKIKGRQANEHRDQRPVTVRRTTPTLANVDPPSVARRNRPVIVSKPPAKPAGSINAAGRWRPSGFAPEPVIPKRAS
jgi:hypothetical protein